MSKKAKLITILLAMALLLSVFSSCKKTEEPIASEKPTAEKTEEATETKQEEEEPQEAELEHMDISITQWSIGNSFPEDGATDAIQDAIYEKFNITFTAKPVTWGDAEEKINLWAASGELPDLIGARAIEASPQYSQWIDDGLVRALPDDLSMYPTLEEIINTGDVQAYSYNDKNYFFPRTFSLDPAYGAVLRGLYVRKDWMDDLGLDFPQSEEEFMDLMRAFTLQDPDKNGKDDTYGLGGGEILSGTFNNYGYIHGTWFKEEDGKYRLGNTGANALQWASVLRQMNKEKTLDPGFDSIPYEERIQEFMTGRIGVFSDAVSAVDSHKKAWDEINPDKNFYECVAFLPLWTVDDKPIYRYSEKVYWSETFVEGSVDDAKMDRICMIYDFMYSREGIALMYFGIEGVDFEYTGEDSVQLLSGKNEDGTYIRPSYQTFDGLTNLFTWRFQLRFPTDPYWTDELKEFYAAEYARVGMLDDPGIDWSIQAIVTPAKSELSIDPTADWMEFVFDETDATDEELYAAMWANWVANGYQDAIDEVTAAAAAMGK